MLADFYISRLSNDMKIAVQKNHLCQDFCTEVWTLLKTDFVDSLDQKASERIRIPGKKLVNIFHNPALLHLRLVDSHFEGRVICV